MKFDAAKWLTTSLWLVIVINLFAPFPGIWAAILNWTGIALAVAHPGEYIFCYKQISARPEGPLLAFVMTFFYGVFYWKDFPSKPWDAD